MSKTNCGTTTIILGALTLVLVPSLGAVRKIETVFGGLRAAQMACLEMNVTAVTSIIMAGADIDASRTDEIAEAVYQGGIVGVVTSIAPFMRALMNPAAERAKREAEAEAEAKAKAEAETKTTDKKKAGNVEAPALECLPSA